MKRRDLPERKIQCMGAREDKEPRMLDDTDTNP
jgi:hypothetical protein